MTFILAFLFQLFALTPLPADVPASLSAPPTEMTVIPRDVFIGDEMEIRYAFSSDRNLLSSESDVRSLDVPDSDNVTVLDIQLTKEADRYVLTARCIAWKTGAVQLPEIILEKGNSTVSTDEDGNDIIETEPDYTIKIPSVTIQSVVDYTGKTDLQPARPPLVIPGTTWIIYVIIVVCVLLFVILIVALIRFDTVKNRFFSLFASALIARNYRLLRRRIKRFLKRYLKADTEVFATEFAHFIRGYMSVRFKTDFDSVTASEFVSVFAAAMNYTGSPEAFGATEVIADILIRCDYVRFSGDTGETGTISGDERSTLCSEFLTAVACYDRESRA